MRANCTSTRLMDAKTADYKQGNIDALGQPPCVCFVPDLEKASGKKPQTFQLKVGGGKAKYSKFSAGTCKDALLHILQYCQLVKKLSHHQDYKKACGDQKKSKQELKDASVTAVANPGGAGNGNNNSGAQRARANTKWCCTAANVQERPEED